MAKFCKQFDNNGNIDKLKTLNYRKPHLTHLANTDETTIEKC